MIKEFMFTYQVPEADCIAGLDVKIECECQGFIFYGEPVVTILTTKFVGQGWSDLWNPNATANKLTEAAKKHYELITISN